MSEVGEGEDMQNSETDSEAGHSSAKRQREAALEELSEEDEYDSSNEKNDKKKRKKAAYIQKYNKAWESEANFKDWVSLGKEGNLFFHCKVCNSDYATAGGRSNLIKHSRGTKHLTRLQSIKKQPVLNVKIFTEKSTLTNQTKEGEILMSAFAATHNMPLAVLDDLPKLMKRMFPDSKIAQNINAGRTKCTKIVQNVTGKYSFEKLVALLKTTKFSLLVDESTDVSATKNLALVVRFYYEERVVDEFLGLLEVPKTSADELYKKIVDFFTEYDIPYVRNMIGFASDGASNMFGVHHSLSVLLKKDIPDLFTMKCICHSFALCANYACETLPRVVEDVARDVYSYLQHSYKRQSEFREFQNFVDVKPVKMLHPSQTRWLSLLQVVKRLLEQYNALILYFTHAAIVDKVLAADMILARLRQKYVLRYLEFLEFVLPFFNRLNVEMQSEETKIHLLYSNVSAVYKSILDCFLKPDYLKNADLENIDFENPHNFVPLEEIYLGSKICANIHNETLGLDTAQLVDFRKRCLQFYIVACQQIVKRFNFREKTTKIIKQLSIVDPRKISSHPSIAPLASLFPNLVSYNDLNTIDGEWRELRNFDIECVNSNSSLMYWVAVSQVKFGNNEQKFPVLSKFLLELHCLPHSSAAVERLFSTINLNKTKTRNRLGNATLTGILHTKALYRNDRSFEKPMDRKLIEYHNDSMYERKKIESKMNS